MALQNQLGDNMEIGSPEILATNYRLEETEAQELHKLLTEMRPLHFRDSGALSEYIVENQLGYKYPHISGVVRMADADAEWDFHGGFPPKIYRIICEELKLGDRGTDARAISFTSFEQLDLAFDDFGMTMAK